MRSPQQSRTPRSWRPVPALALVVLLSACAGPSGGAVPGGGTAAPPAAGTSTSPATPSSPPADGGGPVAPGPNAPDNPGPAAAPVLAWLPPGPASPNDPSPESWYSLLKARNCDRLAQDDSTASDPLWASAIPLCRALVTGDQAAWAEGAAALAQAGSPQSGSCLDLVAYQALTGLIDYHRNHPAVAAIPVQDGSGTACPVQFTGLSSVAFFAPDDGPTASSCGGAVFRLTGRLMDVSSVQVGGTPVEAVHEGDNLFSITAPPAPPGTVTVTVDGPDGPIPGSATLEYLDDPACPSAPVPPTSPEPVPPSAGTG